MIKIRLHGTVEEITPALETIAKNFRVLSISKAYTDRGASVYVRVYLDVEELPEFTKTQAYLKRAWIESKKEGLI